MVGPYTTTDIFFMGSFQSINGSDTCVFPTMIIIIIGWYASSTFNYFVSVCLCYWHDVSLSVMFGLKFRCAFSWLKVIFTFRQTWFTFYHDPNVFHYRGYKLILCNPCLCQTYTWISWPTFTAIITCNSRINIFIHFGNIFKYIFKY